jgi:hypothetical protein
MPAAFQGLRRLMGYARLYVSRFLATPFEGLMPAAFLWLRRLMGYACLWFLSFNGFAVCAT